MRENIFITLVPTTQFEISNNIIGRILYEIKEKEWGGGHERTVCGPTRRSSIMDIFVQHQIPISDDEWGIGYGVPDDVKWIHMSYLHKLSHMECLTLWIRSNLCHISLYVPFYMLQNRLSFWKGTITNWTWKINRQISTHKLYIVENP